MGFQDHFSKQAADYAAFRPHYPETLYRFLLDQAGPAPRIWDVGCGNGQAATALATMAPGSEVVATDPSDEQIAHAMAHPRVEYRVEPAERVSLADESVHLAVSAQAAHWFDHEAFGAEVARVLKPNGALALWCYGLTRVDPAVDAAVARFYSQRVGPYWPKEREHIDAAYRNLPFPFAETPAPAFAIEADWSRDRFLAYIGTWSAVQRCRDREGADPVAELRAALSPVWPWAESRRVRWPIAMRFGRKPANAAG